MIIALTDTINYDTSLTFNEQTPECILFVNEFMSSNQPTYNWDESNRPYQAVYKSDKWNVLKTSIWNTPAPSCGISEEIVTVEGNEIWHETDMIIQIKMSFENNIKMLEQYPEIGVYRKENNIGTYIVNSYTYSYCNYLLDEHRALLTAFGGIINEREV